MTPESSKTTGKSKELPDSRKTSDYFIADFINNNSYAEIDRMGAEMYKKAIAEAGERKAKRRELRDKGCVQFPTTKVISLRGLPVKARDFINKKFDEYHEYEDGFTDIEYYDGFAIQVAQYGWLKRLDVSSLTRDQYAEIFDSYITVLDHVPTKTDVNSLHERLGTPSWEDFARVFGNFNGCLAHYFDWQVRNGADRENLIQEFHVVHAYPLDYLRKL